MLLRTRILLILSLVIVFYIIIDHISLRLIIYPGFISLERQEAKEDLARCAAAINQEINHLDLLCRDWAAWDDTYNFIGDKNKEYLDSNLVEESFYDNKLNLIYFINNEGKVIWGKILDLKEKKVIQLADFPSDIFPLTSPLLDFKDINSEYINRSIKGILVTERGLLLVSSRPIVTSENKGPVRGFFIMGRFLDAELLATLREGILVDFQFWPLTEAAIPSEDQPYIKQISTDKPVIYRENGTETLYVYTKFPDIGQNSNLILRATTLRDIYAKGYTVMQYSQASIIVIGLLLLLILIFLLNTEVVKPITLLTEYIVSTGTDKQPEIVLLNRRQDVVGVLSREFANLMQQVAKSKQTLESLVAERTAALTSTNVSLEQEIRQREQMEKELKIRLEFENVINTISTHFINLPLAQIDKGISLALQTVGEFIGVAHGYIYQRQDHEEYQRQYQWTLSHQEAENDPGAEIFPWVLTKFNGAEILYIPSVANLPLQDKLAKDKLLEKGIFSLLCLPLYFNRQIIGILWFDTIIKQEIWTEDLIALLKLVGEIITNALERKKAEELILRSKLVLEEQKAALEQKNIALKEILEQIELEKKRIKEDVVANVDRIILPSIMKMKRQKTPLTGKDLDLIKDNLEALTSSFGTRITENKVKLSPKEIEICNLIKNGVPNKEIANLLHISQRTVENHRNSIRGKLGLANKDINLTAYLQSL